MGDISQKLENWSLLHSLQVAGQVRVSFQVALLV